MMKNSLNLTFIFVLALFLQSCIGAKPSSTKKSSSTSATTATSTTKSPTFATDETMYWFTSSKVIGTVTVNLNSDSVIYLRGSNVHNFLNSGDSTSNNLAYYQNQKQFCMVADFGTIKQLRVRAVPIYTNNITTKVTERMFRVDLPNEAENKAACPGVINGVASSNASFSLRQICTVTNCDGYSLLTSSKLSLMMGTSISVSEVPLTKITLSSVKLKIDTQSNSSTSDNLCSNSSCEAKGFDCCIEGQCVKDASYKANASLDPAYAQAKLDVVANPLNFLNYPQIYNICLNMTHNSPPVTSNPSDTPTSVAQARVTKYIGYWECLTQSNTSPACAAPTESAPTGGSQYASSRQYVAEQCGCPTGLTQEMRDIKCPSWGVRPIYSSSNEINSNIIDFYCYTPQPENPLGPIVNLNVNVSSRSAPHRFFGKRSTVPSDTVKSYDDLSKAATDLVQEGKDFYYLDDANKASPMNLDYNINSVLGRMHVNLSQAQPAKMVTVELGKTYIVSAISGYYTPCPQCAKDNWFATFSPHPATTGGLGLRAVGFTTSRNSYSANTTLGNYEDTKFGRACYIPVTMIPLSHKRTSVSEELQRNNRLSTQATFYINGYQRDWYGFNKGALIGSFDGVSWFAVGSGRRITATSTKMYLAYNAAFLDLATRTDTVVNIIPDTSSSIAPNYDYDPQLAITDSKQNSAGSCQQYHQCSTDADCVTQLGWEYSCADVSQFKTRWPIYDSDAKEILNQEKTGTIFEILAGTTTPGDSMRRCVYRGAGAPCIRDFSSLNGQVNQKVLTCAPNFYCASLTTNKFNNELARSPNELSDILFGMDSNVLGRPLNYVTATKNLLTEVIANIQYNGGTETLGLTTTQVNDMGICRPGKMLSTNEIAAHSTPDASRRADYINQIASCDSTTTGSSRTVSCPAFGDDLNYLPYNSTIPSPAAYKKQQNMCGGEAKNTASPYASAFASIEKGSLASIVSIVQPVFAADACLRRAGSICHTDLDCGPNKMHEDIVSSLALSYFGGTEAEQNYWKESLVCGQGTPVPALGAANYRSYKLTENRCCREIGKDFTMFTEGPATIVPENMGTNVNLKTDLMSSADPKAAYRYSRYEISRTGASTPTAIPEVQANAEPAKNQWKVINETGSLTCCGGGWVRKFADGTHDWKIKNRLTLDTANFQCLNYRSPLANSNYSSFTADGIIQDIYQREFEYFCKSPGQNGCMQIPFVDLESAYGIKAPTNYLPNTASLQLIPDAVPTAIGSAPTYTPLPSANHARIDTTPIGDITTGAYTFRMNTDVPYQPFVFYFPSGADLYQYSSGQKRSLPFFMDRSLDYGVSLYLPAYVQPAQFMTAAGRSASGAQIFIKYTMADNTQRISNITAKYAADTTTPTVTTPCLNVTNAPSSPGQPVDRLGVSTGEGWCIISDAKTGNRPVIHVKADTSGSIAWKSASVVIEFTPLERNLGLTVTNPGNRYYYLSKLGRLELIGIPQITYEPIYCNNDQNKIIPGIFIDSMTSKNTTGDAFGKNERARFGSKSLTYSTFNPTLDYDEEEGATDTDTVAGIGNAEKKFTYQDKLSHAAIFSAKDFTCCTPLGKETAAAAKCCSGSASNVNGKLTCNLPSGTDLHVYFNKFVSSEGVGEDLLITSGTEEEIDFNAFTGEPKLRDSTFTKIANLGALHCQSGVVSSGGAFGQYPPEPYSGYETLEGQEIVYPLSMVDSIIDSQADDEGVGKFPFDNGFRWDHHYYCK